MKRNYYVIIGEDANDGNQQYWDTSVFGWTSEFDEATRYYSSQVFFMPLPPGATCIIEFTEEGEPVRQFDPDLPLPPGVVSPFAL